VLYRSTGEGDGGSTPLELPEVDEGGLSPR